MRHSNFLYGCINTLMLFLFLSWDNVKFHSYLQKVDILGQNRTNVELFHKCHGCEISKGYGGLIPISQTKIQASPEPFQNYPFHVEELFLLGK